MPLSCPILFLSLRPKPAKFTTSRTAVQVAEKGSRAEQRRLSLNDEIWRWLTVDVGALSRVESAVLQMVLFWSVLLGEADGVVSVFRVLVDAADDCVTARVRRLGR